MRLIDADKLRFRHTVKCNSDTTRPYTLNCISFDEVQNAPTIKAIPIDVLDKIRDEIIVKHLKNIEHDDYSMGYSIALEEILSVVDKYKNEVKE